MSQASATDQELLSDVLSRYEDSIPTCINDGSWVAAEENIFVAFQVLRVAQNIDPDDWSPELYELVERLAFALADLRFGFGDRVADDLEGVEMLAHQVSDKDHAEYVTISAETAQTALLLAKRWPYKAVGKRNVASAYHELRREVQEP